MQKKVCVFVFVFFSVLPLIAQDDDPVVLSYQRNFIRASINTKLDLLNDASKISTINMTPLYVDALSFTKEFYPVLGNDSQLLDIAMTAASIVATYKDVSALPILRDVFDVIPESRVRVACLGTFSVLLGGHTDDIQYLNDWFNTAISVKSVSSQDVKTLVACAQTLGKLADVSSFQVLFRAASMDTLDTTIVSAAVAALNSINSKYMDEILGIIAEKDIKQVYAAFSFAMKKDNLPADEKGKIVEAAFTEAVDLKSSGTEAGNPLLGSLLSESLSQLAELHWSPASPAVVKYFYLVQGDYKNGKAGIDTLIPVIKCMGAMGTTESAQALSILLGLLNSETEQKKTYNEQLMLAVIHALGDLGDKTAFDYLLYVGYLDYPETIKKAAKDALAKLEW